jgi:hypothetical protein
MARDFVPASSGVAAQLQALVVPALRKHREGRGTLFVGDTSGIKTWATRLQRAVSVRLSSFCRMSAIRSYWGTLKGNVFGCTVKPCIIRTLITLGG